MFILLQKLLPKHLLSRIVGQLAASEWWIIKAPFIRIFCLFYDINLTEAARTNRSDYVSFNDFFTRALKPGARSIEGAISSPADGTVAALGPITDGTLIQSKGHSYDVGTLLGVTGEAADRFRSGSFITIYLAPHNYHRVHVPCNARLNQATYIPGELFSVNQTTAENLPGLFTRNERLVCDFLLPDGGHMSEVLVGAMLVAGIQTVWQEAPYKPRLHDASDLDLAFEQGQELGQFQMGSTVILLFEEALDFKVAAGQSIRMGEAII